MKECDLNAERSLQLCGAIDGIQLATEFCIKRRRRRPVFNFLLTTS
jgi:hypothetical protein